MRSMITGGVENSLIIKLKKSAPTKCLEDLHFTLPDLIRSTRLEVAY